MTFSEALKKAMDCLVLLGASMPGLEARELVAKAARNCGAHVTAKNITALRSEDTPEGFEDSFDVVLERRLRGEPLAYIIGEWDFYGLTFEITPDVLIPRSDTETVVEKALEMLSGKDTPRILDLCCGSGAIGAAILSQKTGAGCVFADISSAALDVCRRNIARLGFRSRSDAAKIDATEPAEETLGKFDLIVCNPPYISADEMQALDVSISFEPRDALYGGSDGLAFYRAIANGYKKVIADGGGIVFECGQYQAQDVMAILAGASYRDMEIKKDLNKIDRVVSARI